MRGEPRRATLGALELAWIEGQVVDQAKNPWRVARRSQRKFMSPAWRPEPDCRSGHGRLGTVAWAVLV